MKVFIVEITKHFSTIRLRKLLTRSAVAWNLITCLRIFEFVLNVKCPETCSKTCTGFSAEKFMNIRYILDTSFKSKYSLQRKFIVIV